MDTFFVYIIYSPSLDKFYIGYTTNLVKRLNEHNSGVSSFTSKVTDWVLKYNAGFPERELAMKREREIKNKKSRKYIEWLIRTAG